MALVEFNKETCTKCGACIAACGGCILIPQAGGYPGLFPGADQFCTRCGHCVTICPSGGIIHKEISIERCPLIEKKQEVSFEQASQLIKSRRSIREFQDKPVPRVLIERIIDAARYAPTAHNMQDVQWLVIDNKDDLHKLTAIGIDWFRSMSEGNTPLNAEMQEVLKMFELGVNIFLRDAPAVVVTFAEKENLMAATNCVIALSYFDLLAKSAGLGCCWNGYFFISAGAFKPMIQAIGLPKSLTPYAALMIGYPKFKYHRVPPRKKGQIVYHSQ